MIYEKYLERFPMRFRKYLEIEKHKKRFYESVWFDYEKIKVYRAIHDPDELSESDFLCNIDEADFYSCERKPQNTLQNYAISVNESIEMLKATLKFPNAKRHLLGIALGEMSSEFGPADFDEDRPHHNWYLYEGTAPQLVSLFEVEKGNDGIHTK